MATDRTNATGVLRRFGLILAASACTMGFLVVSTSASSASSYKSSSHHKSHTKHKHKKITTGSATGTSGSTSACSILDDSAGSAKFASEMAADEKSGSLSSMKSLFLTLADDMEKLSTGGVTGLQSAPASVQAAIKTISAVIPKLKAALESASTEPELLAAFGQLGDSTALQNAQQILSTYVSADCGG